MESLLFSSSEGKTKCKKTKLKNDSMSFFIYRQRNLHAKKKRTHIVVSSTFVSTKEIPIILFNFF
jgi:hypothetical protein